jgi:glycine cleavage system aminomethyltransferase T
MNTGIRRIGIAMIVLFLGLVAQLTYLQVARSNQLANASGNPRKFFSNIRRDRGPIETSDGAVVALSTSTNDEYKHQRVYPNDTATQFADVVGYESIIKDGKPVGYVTSGAYGHCVERSLAAGYVPATLALDGERFEIDILGESCAATVRLQPLYDPEGLRLRS